MSLNGWCFSRAAVAQTETPTALKTEVITSDVFQAHHPCQEAEYLFWLIDSHPVLDELCNTL